MRLPRSQGDRAVAVVVALLVIYLLYRWLS